VGRCANLIPRVSTSLAIRGGVSRGTGPQVVHLPSDMPYVSEQPSVVPTIVRCSCEENALHSHILKFGEMDVFHVKPSESRSADYLLRGAPSRGARGSGERGQLVGACRDLRASGSVG
jgi:hypothetical protein